MLATSGDVKEVEGDVGGNLDQSSRVQCAVIYYPMTDLLNAGADHAARFPESAKNEDAGGLSAQLLGYKDPKGMSYLREIFAKNDKTNPYWKYVALSELSNPVNYVSKDDPPILLGHSSMDRVVSVEQSERLYKKYIDNGLDASFYRWGMGAHGVVGTDIEAATSEWIAKKLLVDLAPKK